MNSELRSRNSELLEQPYVVDDTAILETAMSSSIPNSVGVARPTDVFRIPTSYRPWTTGEEAELRSLWGADKPILEIAQLLGRTRDAIANKAKKLKLFRYSRWSAPELEKLYRLIGTAPKRVLIKQYKEWAAYHGYPERTNGTIWQRVRNAPVSYRLKRRYDWYSTHDVADAVGCSHATACDWFVKYNKVLNPIPVEDYPAGGNMVSRKRLRRFLIENPQIVDRYRPTIELYWLVDLLARP